MCFRTPHFLYVHVGCDTGPAILAERTHLFFSYFYLAFERVRTHIFTVSPQIWKCGKVHNPRIFFKKLLSGKILHDVICN